MDLEFTIGFNTRPTFIWIACSICSASSTADARAIVSDCSQLTSLETSTATIAREIAPCLPAPLLADSARDYWPLSRTRLTRRGADNRTAFGGGDHRIRRKPKDGMPAVELERFARTASHVGG